MFPETISAIRTVPHSPDLPVPLPPTSLDLSSDSQELSNDETVILYTNHATDVGPKKFTQDELNDLIRDLNPSK